MLCYPCFLTEYKVDKYYPIGERLYIQYKLRQNSIGITCDSVNPVMSPNTVNREMFGSTKCSMFGSTSEYNGLSPRLMDFWHSEQTWVYNCIHFITITKCVFRYHVKTVQSIFVMTWETAMVILLFTGTGDCNHIHHIVSLTGQVEEVF
jgi:hypothetical protein